MNSKNNTVVVTARQLEVISSIAASPIGISPDTVDNRVVRSLVAKKFVKTSRGSLVLTAAGKRTQFGTKTAPIAGSRTFNV